MNSRRKKYQQSFRVDRWVKVIVVIIMAALLFSTCEDRFEPEIDAGVQNLLVVEGTISNQPGPYTVKLSLSTPPDNPEYIPASGYQVIIQDDIGDSETLTEVETGVYQTSPQGIQGVVGRAYKIRISSTNGKTYSSEFQKLPNPVGIENVYHKLEYYPHEDFPVDVAGYQFYVDTEMAEDDSTYMLWNLNATYRYQSDFIIRWIYDGELRPFTAFDSLRKCWKTEDVLDIFVYRTDALAQPQLTGFPLHYVPVTTRHLSIRYSLLTTQYTISREASDFWISVKEQHSGQDQLFTRQPYQVRGNIFNTDNSDEAVLGYFMVAGEAQKRIFVNKPDPPVKMRYPVCVLTEADYMNFGTIFLTAPSEWPQFATFDNFGGNAYPNQDCLDCRLRGGTIEKPDFWIDD
jgi:hypothetical protein